MWGLTLTTGSEGFMEKSVPAVRILIADDHPIFRAGLRRALEVEPGFRVVGEAESGGQAVELARRLKPDILLLDLAMPGVTGLEALRELSAAALPVRTIVLAAVVEPPQVVEALQLGARGIVVKNAAGPVLIRCIYTVMAGQYWVGHGAVADVVKALRVLIPRQAAGTAKKTFGLTERELQIVAEVVAGCTNKEIAEKFSISEGTVKSHVTNIFDKLGVSNRLEMTVFALKHQLTDPL